jgi:hypothetical protein
MAQFKIPNQGSVRQLNIGDIYGELWSSFNIDLHTNPGKIKLARPFKQIMDDTDLNGERVMGFTALSSESGFTTAYVLTERALYKASNPYTTWSEETRDSINVSNANDIVVFKGQLVFDGITNLNAFDPSGGGTFTSGWWTARGNPSLTTTNPVPSVPRVLEVVGIGTETLVVLDGSEVHAYAGGIASGAITNVTMDIDSFAKATCVKSGIRSVWIGSYTTESGEAFVYQWDGASTNYSQKYPSGAKSVLAMELDDDVPVIITERGEIKRFNNVGFTTIAQFPFASKPLFPENYFLPTNEVRPIHPKGVKRIGRNLLIAVNWGEDTPIDERTPAGIWVCNLDTGSLTHLASPENSAVWGVSSPLMYLNDALGNNTGRLFVGYENTDNEVSVYIEDLDDSVSNYSYFTTTEIEAEKVKDAYDQIIVKAVMDDNDAVVVKYRTSKDIDYPIVADATWLDAITFNTTDDLSYVKTRFDAGHKDEIEVLTGSGAGRLAHITSITKSASVYSVTIDESIGTATEDLQVRFDNWQKIPESFTNADGEMKRLGIGEVSTWAQFKVEMRGKAGYPEIRQFQIKSNNKEK